MNDANTPTPPRRCKAHNRRGDPCGAYAVTGWTVCRMHGAGGGQPPGPAHPAWKHGLRSREFMALRAEITRLQRETKTIQEMIP